VKKRYVIIGLLASSLASVGQPSNSTYKKKKLSTTSVELVMSYYTQDNEHSAVTGGIGTEDLQVYATQLAMDVRRDSSNAFHFDAGVDVISSASTDNIDFVISSASKVDLRTHINAGYSRRLKDTRTTVGLISGLSIESDFFSVTNGLSLHHVNASQSRELSIALQTYLDDLRWGRLHDGKPEELIYPVELRDTVWFDHYRRSSFSVEFGFYQVINRRMSLGIYPGITYQSGLLSTPFHRVYFNDESLRVENLPGRRLKLPIGIQLNTFLGGRWISRSYYRFYWDNFGINAHTLNLETSLKVTPMFTASTFFRLHEQHGSDYFRPYKDHDPSEVYYTSDYDLSSLTTFKSGVTIRYAPYRRMGRSTFEALEFRYAFYSRSDGLKAHMITLFLGYSFDKKLKE
jgi:hypothetical protein